MLDAAGGIECDLTVARNGEQQFTIVTGTGFATHDFDWIERNIPPGANAQLVDVTSATSVLALMGPASRAILEAVCDDDVSNDAFPFGSVRRIGVAGCELDALRITYVGELGYELHVPVESAVAVYDALMLAGRPLGLVDAGYRAIESCRLEKGYRAWGSDIGPDHTPIEAGLGWAVKDRTGVDFIGRPAIADQRAGGVRKRLAGFTTDPSVVLLGRETIYRDGERVGWLSSAGYGYTIGRSIGYGYVRHPDGVYGRVRPVGHLRARGGDRTRRRARCRCSRSTIRAPSASGHSGGVTEWTGSGKVTHWRSFAQPCCAAFPSGNPKR